MIVISYLYSVYQGFAAFFHAKNSGSAFPRDELSSQRILQTGNDGHQTGQFQGLSRMALP
jgi:hypothetical protein